MIDTAFPGGEYADARGLMRGCFDSNDDEDDGSEADAARAMIAEAETLYRLTHPGASAIPLVWSRSNVGMCCAHAWMVLSIGPDHRTRTTEPHTMPDHVSAVGVNPMDALAKLHALLRRLATASEVNL